MDGGTDGRVRRGGFDHRACRSTTHRLRTPGYEGQNALGVFDRDLALGFLGDAEGGEVGQEGLLDVGVACAFAVGEDRGARASE